MAGRSMDAETTANQYSAQTADAELTPRFRYARLRFSSRWINPLEISALAAVFDVCLVTLAGLLSHSLVYPDRDPNPIELTVLSLAAIAVFGVLQTFGFYSSARLVSRRVGLGRLMPALLLACGLVSMIVLLMNAGFVHARQDRVEWLMMKPIGEFWTLALVTAIFLARPRASWWARV
jgi:hypothetical protein